MAIIKATAKKHAAGKGGHKKNNFGGKGGGMMVWVPAGSSMPFFPGNGNGKFHGKAAGKGQFQGKVDKTKEKLRKFEPSQKAWVGGLSKTTTWKKLEKHVKEAGDLKPALVDVNEKKGTGVVCFQSGDDVATAVAVLNGSELDGKSIEVDVWEKVERPPKAEGEEKPKKKNKKKTKTLGLSKMALKKPVSKVSEKLKTVDPTLKVWIGGLTEKTTFKEISDHFKEKFAKPKLVDLLKKGKAVVTYESTDEVASAVSIVNGTELNGNVIEVDVWTKPEKKEKA
jgi:RNA recognition motif-containing protein